MGLTAVTLLGDNTVPILDDLCRCLGARPDLEIRLDARRPASSTEAAEWAGDADLIWGCGYLMCSLIDTGRLDADIVAAPIFAGELAPVYRSVIVTANPAIGALADAQGGCLAVNETVSWSGHHAVVAHLAAIGSDLTMFARVVTTGSHRASVEAVADGVADVAAIDHTVWAHVASDRSAVGGVRVIDRTQDWPGPPFAVRGSLSAGRRRALVAAMAAVSPGVVVGLAGIAPAARADYEVMLPVGR